jgi:hypothetical protein
VVWAELHVAPLRARQCKKESRTQSRESREQRGQGVVRAKGKRQATGARKRVQGKRVTCFWDAIPLQQWPIASASGL